MLLRKEKSHLKKQFSQAVKDNNIQLMKLIFDQGLCLEELNDEKHMYLVTAVKKDSEAMVRLLIWQGVYLNKQDKEGKTALHLACHKSLKVFTLLLHFGANVNLQDNQGLTPLHITCMKRKKSPERAKALLKKGANVEICCKNGQTALHLAAEHNVDLVQVLLNKNFSLINSTDNRGYTPLHKACLNGKVEIVLILLDQGAEVNIRNNDDITPLHLASRYLKLITILLNHGAEINAKCKYNQTPLHKASISKHNRKSKVIDFLIANGAEINAQDKFGNTPLHYAMENTDEIVQTLIDRGADVNLRNAHNHSPYEESIYLEGSFRYDSFLPQELVRLVMMCRYALVNHIIKLKAAQLCDADISKEPYRKEYEKTKQNSLLELEKIKLYTFNNIYLHIFITKKNKQHYLSIEDAEKYGQFLNSETFLKQFPVYGHIIRNKFKSSLLMTRAVESFYSQKRKSIFRGLPICVTESIMAFLSEGDLENFIRSEFENDPMARAHFFKNAIDCNNSKFNV